MSEITRITEAFYNAMEGSEMVEHYMDRHGIESLGILTIYDDKRAAQTAAYLADRIRGKVVVEIGSGIGLLALHLAEYAAHVYAIEVCPAWTTSFVAVFYEKKPKNATWIFGAAEEMIGQLKGDVALFCTHSDHEGMERVAAQFAPVVIDVYRELGDKAEQRRGGTY